MFRRVVAVGAVVVIVLVGYAAFRAFSVGPQETAQRFFRALADRNLSLAQGQVAGDGVIKTPGLWSAMWHALSDGRYQPPRDARFGGWQHAEVGGERVVAVQYELGNTTHSSLLKLRRNDGRWLITNGVGAVEVNYAGVAVNGQRLDTGKNLLLLPGIYELGSAPRAALVTAVPMNVVIKPDTKGTAELRTTLTEAGRQAARQRIEAMLTECERSTSGVGAGCPFKFTGPATAKVKWTILSRPEPVFTELEPGVLTMRGSGAGSVGVRAEDGGAGIERVDSFSIDGKCVEIDDRVSCTFSA